MLDKYIKSGYWRDVFYQTSGNTIAQLVGIIGIPILARLYSPEAFAIQSVFLQGVMLMSGFLTWRYEYFIQLVNNDHEAYLLMWWIFRFGIYMSFSITLCVWVVDYFGIEVGLKKEWVQYLYYVPISSLLVNLAIVIQHNVQRLGDFRASGKAEVSGKILYVLSGALLSLIVPIFGLIITTGFSAVGKLIALRAYLLVFLKGLWLYKGNHSNNAIAHPRSRFFSQANGLVFSNVIVSISGALPVFFIGSQYGDNSLGQYALVMSTVFLPSSLIGSAIGNVFYQRAAMHWKDYDKEGLKSLWKETFIKLSTLGAPVYGVFYLISSWIYPYIFGTQWQQAGVFGELLVVYAFSSFLAGPVDKISLVLGYSVYLPVIHIVRMILVLVGILIALEYELNILSYILLLSSSMSLMYIFDLIGGRILMEFSSRRV